MDDDPYELHAHHFLNRLQRLSQALAGAEPSLDSVVAKSDAIWPQVLSAFWWANNNRESSSVAADLANALASSAEGDIARLQQTRSAADLRRYADALAQTARRQEEPNDAAFLYRFAGIAKVQAGILGITEETGADIRTVLGLATEWLAKTSAKTHESDLPLVGLDRSVPVKSLESLLPSPNELKQERSQN